MNDSSCVFEVIYEAVTAGNTKLSVSRMCEYAGVSRSGYYAWVAAAPVREAQEQQDRDDFKLIYGHTNSEDTRKVPKAFICACFIVMSLMQKMDEPKKFYEISVTQKKQ